MSNIKVTSHALQQYESRTGRRALESIFTLMEALEEANTFTYEEATKQHGFKIVKQFKGDRYLIWYDKNIKEDVCGIVAHDNALKTVLTKKIYSWADRSMKVRNEIDYKYGSW